MKRFSTLVLPLLAATVTAATISSCAALQQVGSALSGLRKLQFKLGDVQGFNVDGINISNLSSANQINPLDLARLGTDIAQKRLPVSFTLNVLARNPNDGTAAGTKPTPLYLSRLDWTLLIDNRTTINGIVNQQLEIPGSGQTTTIPLTMNLDLYKFFADQGLNDLLNLALALGGSQGSASRLKLTARVQVTVPGIGAFDYPGELTIVDTQFTNP